MEVTTLRKASMSCTACFLFTFKEIKARL
uniref:Uncharacterized protein n=1 Tax=Rhizophora mucronata TaxID=61149 RepID=A0A2P2PFE5_RHIMU